MPKFRPHSTTHNKMAETKKTQSFYHCRVAVSFGYAPAGWTSETNERENEKMRRRRPTSSMTRTSECRSWTWNNVVWSEWKTSWATHTLRHEIQFVSQRTQSKCCWCVILSLHFVFYTEKVPTKTKTGRIFNEFLVFFYCNCLCHVPALCIRPCTILRIQHKLFILIAHFFGKLCVCVNACVAVNPFETTINVVCAQPNWHF